MICIKNDGYYLTIGKFYPVHYKTVNGDYVGITNDIGELSEYPIENFK